MHGLRLVSLLEIVTYTIAHFIQIEKTFSRKSTGKKFEIYRVFLLKMYHSIDKIDVETDAFIKEIQGKFDEKRNEVVAQSEVTLVDNDPATGDYLVSSAGLVPVVSLTTLLCLRKRRKRL
jgi:hypothetical protein